MEQFGHGEMNYKRRKPANRKLRRTGGYNSLGKDLIRKEIDRDHLNNVLEITKKFNFYKKIL